MRKHALWLVLFLSSFLYSFAGPAFASGSGSDRLTLNCSGESLRTVLKTMSDRSGTGFMFQDDLVEGRTVICSFDDLSLDQALERILSPLSISYKRIPSGPVVLYDARTAERLIRGWVVDAANGNGLPFANIVQEGTATGTNSDTDGSFVLRNSHPDSCTIRVSYIGYHPEQIHLSTADGSDSIRVSMHEKPIESESVRIEADRVPDLEMFVEPGVMVFSPGKLDIVPVADGSGAGRVLQMLPGVNSAYDVPSVWGFYGGAENENLVLLDGIPVRKPDAFLGWLNPFHPRMIENVHVWKGGVPANAGDALGGIVKWTGNTVPDRRFNAGVGADLFSSNAFVEWPITNTLRLFTGIRRSHDDIVHGRVYHPIHSGLMSGIPEISGESDNIDGYSFSDIAAKIVYDESGRNRFQSTFIHKQEKDRWISETHDSTVDFSGNEVTRLENNGLSFQWNLRWTNRFSSCLLLAYSLYAPDYNFSWQERIPDSTISFMSLRRIDSELDDRVIRFENTLNLARLSIDFGAEIAESAILERSNSIQTQLFPSDSTDITMVQRKRRSGVQNTAAFIQSRFSPARKLDVSFGMRFISSDFTDRQYPGSWSGGDTIEAGRWKRHRFYADPRFHAVLKPNDRLSLGLTYAKQHQFINHAYIQDTFGSPSMEKGWMAMNAANPGINYDPDIHSSLMAVNFLYRMDSYHMMIEAYTKSYSSMMPVYQELGDRGAADGIEFMIRKTGGLITGWASFNLNRANAISDRWELTCPSYWQRPAGFKSLVSFPIGGFHLSLAGSFAAGKPYSKAYKTEEGLFIQINNARLPSYQRIDLHLSKRFKGFLSLHWEAGISLFNILDRSNIDYRDIAYEYVEQPPQFDTPTMRVVYNWPLLGFTPMASVGVSLR